MPRGAPRGGERGEAGYWNAMDAALFAALDVTVVLRETRMLAAGAPDSHGELQAPHEGNSFSPAPDAELGQFLVHRGGGPPVAM